MRGANLLKDEPHHVYMGAIVESDPAIAGYAIHPRLLGMAEELMGSEARIVEVNAHINRRDPDADLSAPATFRFHRGTDVPFGTHRDGGLFHCNFVKTLTNLTELGPDDGGTTVIAGSHKLAQPPEELIACAYRDRSLIHQVVAPAGSTLLFGETLIHATGQVRSDRERAIVICGYAPTMYQSWEDGELSTPSSRTCRSATGPCSWAAGTGCAARGAAPSPTRWRRGPFRSRNGRSSPLPLRSADRTS